MLSMAKITVTVLYVRVEMLILVLCLNFLQSLFRYVAWRE